MTRRISSLQWDAQTVYIFRGDDYARLDAPSWSSGEVKPLSGNWPGLDVSSVDAAIALPSGKAYLFCDDVYYRYDMAEDKVDDGYPQLIASGWPGLPESGLSAAVAWPGGKAYFFASDQYFRYDIENDKVDDGYPQSIESGWPGLMTSVDAVVLLSESEALFINGKLCQRYDIAKDRAIGDPVGLTESFPPVWPGASTTSQGSSETTTSNTAGTGAFAFSPKSGESINDRVVRCCHEALDAGPMGEKDRHEDYRSFISCGQETSDAKAEALTHVRTSCAMFVRAVRHWCGTAPEGPYKPGTGMFTSMGNVGFDHPSFVKYTGSEVPEPGNWFYIGTNGKNDGHTGIFLEDLGDGRWQTAEGGGGDGTLCRITERTFAGRSFADNPKPIQGWFDCNQVGLPESP